MKPTVYGFWDGDFTFWTFEYEGDVPDSFIRVRIDNESPEQRARENADNYNNMRQDWKNVRPSTDKEIEKWTEKFKERFPLRTNDESSALRFLRDSGPVEERDVHPLVRDALVSLTKPRPCVRDFHEANLVFVRLRDGTFSLTADGAWLTSLME